MSWYVLVLTEVIAGGVITMTIQYIFLKQTL